mgnify:CR=1 FL=1
MKKSSEKPSDSLHASAFAALVFSLLFIELAMADVTDISNQPLANVAGTVAIKPNVMIILDDSGSMGWDYTPDYVAETKTSLKPKYTAATAFDGSEIQGSLNLVSQTRANTSAWTAVRTDGFNKQNRNQLGASVTTVNLVTDYPDRVYCTAKSDSATDTTKCKTNSSCS